MTSTRRSHGGQQASETCSSQAGPCCSGAAAEQPRQQPGRAVPAACLSLLLACAALNMYIKSQSVGIARRLLQGPVWLEEALIREDASRKAAPPGALDTCRAAYSEFLPSIHEDLLPYAGGITKQMMNQTLVNESFYNGFAGIPIIFKDGQAYMLGNKSIKGLPMWIKRELLVYSHAMVHLADKFGRQLPDTEMVIYSDDVPGLPAFRELTRPPGFRMCRTDDHPDILIPIWHLYEYSYSKQFLATIGERDQRFPWAQKKEVLYSNPGGYHRHIANDMTERRDHNGNATNMPRKVFVEWAAQANDSRLDVTFDRWLAMGDWAQHKYVAHVDGITCSSRLDKLLALGSLVFKEESGYRAFYHRLLRPMQHYVPFWHKWPQEVLQGLDWAQANDEQAQRIALAGQELVKKYLSKQALDCYWLMLLVEYSRLFKFKPAGPDRGYFAPLVPLAEWLQREHEVEEEGVWVDPATIELEDPPELLEV